jgi:chemotaxis protein CheD
VGISDCKVSWDPSDLLVTYALGSCIAVALYDPIAKVGGLLHYMLPDSALDANKAQQNPYMFADTGIPRLIAAVKSKGAQAPRMVVRLAGGAQVLDSQGTFQIGKRNYLAAKRILWKAGSDRGRGRGRRGIAHHAPGNRDRPDVDTRRSRHRCGDGLAWRAQTWRAQTWRAQTWRADA